MKIESCNAIKLILIGVQFLFLVMAFELSFERKREPVLLSPSACIQIQDKFGIICLVIKSFAQCINIIQAGDVLEAL